MIAWSISAALSILAGIIVFIRKDPVLFGSDTILYGGARLIGFFKDPNVTASFFVPPFLYFYHSLTKNKWTAISVFDFIIIVFIGGGLLLTFSRAGWLGALVGVIIISVRNIQSGQKPRIYKTALFFSLAILLLVVFIASDFELLLFDFSNNNNVRITSSEYFKQRLKLQYYDNDRFEAWRATWSLFKSNPVFGTGPGTVEFYHSISSHNTYLRFLAENGIIGGLFLVILLIFVFRRFKPHLDFESWIPTAVIGLLTSGLFIDSFHWRHLIILFSFGIIQISRTSESGFLKKNAGDNSSSGGAS